MRLRFLTSALLLLSLQTFAAPRNEADTLGAYLSRMDMLWDNDITADPVVKEGESHGHWGRKGGYYSGAIMGNGLLGTNFYELEDGAYRLNVGRSDVTEMRKPFNLFNSARLPIGYFRLKTVGNVTDEKMRLSIYDATATGRITTECGALNFRTYVHSCVDCIVFETEAEGEECGYEWSFVPQKAISPRAIFGSPNLPKDYLNSTGNANPVCLQREGRGVPNQNRHTCIRPFCDNAFRKGTEVGCHRCLGESDFDSDAQGRNGGAQRPQIIVFAGGSQSIIVNTVRSGVLDDSLIVPPFRRSI